MPRWRDDPAGLSGVAAGSGIRGGLVGDDMAILLAPRPG
jgi:hypothetical protein